MNILSTTRVADIELPPTVVADGAMSAVQCTQPIDGQRSGSVQVPMAKSTPTSLSYAPEYQATPTAHTTHLALPPHTYRTAPPPPGTATARPTFILTANTVAPATVIHSYSSQSQSTPTDSGDNHTNAPTAMPTAPKKPASRGLPDGGSLDFNA